MKSLIVKTLNVYKGLLMLLAFWVGSIEMMVAQSVTATHPVQIFIIHNATDSLDNLVKEQTQRMDSIAVTANTMAGMFLIMKEWESKYNSYLKTVEGYASSLKAGTTLYAEGVKTIYYVNQVKKAVAANTEGFFATAAMNNLYVEVAADLIKTYRLLKICVASGGRENMLTGAERTQLLWLLDDSLHQLNKKLQRLSLSIAYFNMKDVWKQATLGIIRCDKKRIANDAKDRWKRTVDANRILYE